MEGEVTEELPLVEALARWGDPALAAETTQLASEGYDGPSISILGGPITPDERKYGRYQEVRELLQQELLEKLRQGVLIATGFDVRAAADAAAITIPPERWRSLVPRYDDASATDGTMTITGIRVREAAAQPVGKRRLIVGRANRHVWFDGKAIRLTPRSFDLLLILAEAALSSGGLVCRRDIEGKLWKRVPVNKKAVGDAIGKLKNALGRQGVDDTAVRLLIDNRRSEGYRLTLASHEIQTIG